MKQKRQAMILSIIEQYDIETQDELLEKLAEAGFNTTQATISRDIREINLTKVAVAGGRQKYTRVVQKGSRGWHIIHGAGGESDSDQDSVGHGYGSCRST